MKDFWIYTGARIGLFVVCYAVLAGLWMAIVHQYGATLLVPFIIAALLSSALSLKYLRGPRERFAARVEGRASRATAKFEELRSREDDDQA